MRTYEAIIILKTETEEEIKKTVSSVIEVIKKHKGEILAEDLWGKKETPYLIKKQKEAVYLRLSFKAEPLSIREIEGAYKLNQKILRITIVNREEELQK